MEGYIQTAPGSKEWHYGFFSEYEAPEKKTGKIMTWPLFDSWIRDTHKNFYGTEEEARSKASELGTDVKRFVENGGQGRVCFGVMRDNLHSRSASQ